MKDKMNEYELPEFHGEEETPVEEPAVEEVVVEEPGVELPAEEPVIVTEIAEGAVLKEPDTVVEQKPPSKFQLVMHKVAIWALGILTFALVLYLVFLFVMYRPLKLEHETLMDTNETLEEQLSDYRDDLDGLTGEHATVTTMRDELLSDTGLYQGYVHFLNLKNDMLLLQKAYLEEDNEAATLALTKINRDLADFSTTLEGADEPLADVLFAKVALLTTVEDDTAANIEEVETIYDFLLEMEDDLYGTLE